ncbi:MAG: stage III sporulation protein AB [Lachnospiraceae bacterium]|nr:stage III sporulation protein AB [Lachnospiraceae bacterium]MDY4096508.1 stage III sporulation protein AB [Lachnospiraceae bacterium]
MLDLLGGVLVIGGMTGFGFLYLEKGQRRVEELKRLAYLFKLLKSEITFKKQPLPFACRASGEKIREREGRILEAIAGDMEEGNGMSFREIWRSRWKEQLQLSMLSEYEKNKVLEFSSFVGYEEETLQENMMECQVEEFTLLAEKVRDELEKKKRVVLLLSSCTGILFVLILL